MKLTETKIDVTLWFLAGLVLAAGIWGGIWLELNVADNTYREIVVDGKTYATGADSNGLAGVFTGLFGLPLVGWWLFSGVEWLYDRAS